MFKRMAVCIVGVALLLGLTTSAQAVAPPTPSYWVAVVFDDIGNVYDVGVVVLFPDGSAYLLWQHEGFGLRTASWNIYSGGDYGTYGCHLDVLDDQAYWDIWSAFYLAQSGYIVGYLLDENSEPWLVVCLPV